MSLLDFLNLYSRKNAHGIEILVFDNTDSYEAYLERFYIGLALCSVQSCYDADIYLRPDITKRTVTEFLVIDKDTMAVLVKD